MSLLLDQNLVVAAGAGSGKTHALCTLALGLYGGAGGRAPLDPARVWAVTFTEKAAAELARRLAKRVHHLAQGNEDAELTTLFGERAPLPSHWAAVAAQLTLAPIGTFHGLCGELLRRHAGEAHLDPRFTILDESRARTAFDRAMEEVLPAALSHVATRELVRHLGGLEPLRAAVRQLHEKLGEEGRDPASLLPSASNPKTAMAAIAESCRPLQVALEALLRSDQPRLSAAIAVAEREASRLSTLSPDSIGEWYPALAAVVAATRGTGNLTKLPRQLRDDLRATWSVTQAALAEWLQAEAAVSLTELLERVQASYQQIKERLGALDFTDLMRRTRDLLRDDRIVRREAKRRLDAVLVDEFQDSNRLQLDLCYLLCEERSDEQTCADPTQLPLADGVLCLVGDRKQSIYEFRGADVGLFVELTNRARATDRFRHHSLARSYRSRPPLVRFVNQLFERLFVSQLGAPYRIGWVPEDALEPVREANEAAEPAVALLEVSSDLSGEARRRAEAQRVASEVAKLLAEGPWRGCEIALLFRAFTHLDMYRSALATEGVASVVAGGRGFFGAREVRDAAALLALLCDPGSRLASVAAYRSPACQLSSDALVLLAAEDALPLGRHFTSHRIALPDPDRARLDRLAALVDRLHREVDRLGPARSLELAFEALDLWPVFAATSDGEQRVANLHKLLQWLRDNSGSSSAVLATHLLTAAEGPDHEPPAEAVQSADPNAVRILTIHAAKGLEFPVVFIPELGAHERHEVGPVLFERNLGLAIRPLDSLGQRIASTHAEAVAAELHGRRQAESLRLLYVAVTRARERLILCGSPSRSPSWRTLLDEAIPSLADPPAVLPPRTSSRPLPRPHAEESTPVAEALVAQVGPPRIAPKQWITSVTDLATLSRCERRYYYRALIGLEEQGLAEGSFDGAEGPASLGASARGTLAHLLLERVDLALAERSPSPAIEAAARAAGVDPAAPEVAPILADALAFLTAPLGRELTSPATPRVYRELPFVFQVEGQTGAQLVIKGQIDLLMVDREGTLKLLDYKYAHAAPRAAYDFQLATYALAARRILSNELALRSGIVWLRDRRPPQLVEQGVPAAKLHEAQLVNLADRLAEAHRTQQFAQLPERSQCGDCGYQFRCWGRATPVQLNLLV